MEDKGFGLISILIAVGILAVVIGGGYYYQSKNLNLNDTNLAEQNSNTEDVLDEAEDVKDALSEHNQYLLKGVN